MLVRLLALAGESDCPDLRGSDTMGAARRLVSRSDESLFGERSRQIAKIRLPAMRHDLQWTVWFELPADGSISCVIGAGFMIKYTYITSV